MLNISEPPVLSGMKAEILAKCSSNPGQLDRHVHARQTENYKYREMNPNEEEARAAYNELLRLGARPSRPIREEFAYHTWTYNRGDSKHKGKVEWYDPEHDALGHADEASLMPHHWLIERRLFEGQLQRWREFRKAQKKSKGDSKLRNSLLIRAWEMPALDSADPILTQKLTTIQDWRAYRAYMQGKVARLDSRRMAARDQVSHSRFTFLRTADIPEKDKIKAELKKNVIQFSVHHQLWLAEKAVLGRVDAEILKIINETVHEISVHDRALLIQYHEHTAKVAQYLAEQLGTLTSSAWPLRSPAASLSALDKLYHWEQEILRLSDLYQEWKENLGCLQMNHDLSDGNTTYLLSPEPNVTRDRSLWEQHVQFRQEQVVNAKKWQRCWIDVEYFCMKEGAAQVGNFLPTDYLETARKEQGLAYVSIQEAAQALKIAEQEAAEAAIFLNQSQALPRCSGKTASTWIDGKIVRKRKADGDAPMEPQSKRVCLSRKVFTADKLKMPQRRPVKSATFTSINSTWKCDHSASPALKVPPSAALKMGDNELSREGPTADNFTVLQHQPLSFVLPTTINGTTKGDGSASPHPKLSPSLALKMEKEELPQKVSAADDVIVPQDLPVLSATPTSAMSAPSASKRARSASLHLDPSSSTAISAEDEGPQINTKKTHGGKKVARTTQNGTGTATKSNKDRGKASATKTGRVTKPKDYRAEAKANGGVRRSERIKEMKKNLRCREGCTEMHEHQY